MIRKNFYLTEKQSNILKKMKDLTISEHIRRAIDDYIVKRANQNATQSPSVKGE